MSKYKRNYLKQVLARIDFSVPLKEISSGPKSEFVQNIVKTFPIKETNKLIGQEFQLAPQGIRSRDVQATEWLYHGVNREKMLSLSERSLFVEYKKYDNFDNLKKDFTESVSSLYSAYPDLIVSRFGLRYINHIELDEPSPLDWSKYIDANLTSELSTSFDADKLSRYFSALEYNFGDMTLHFQYGNYNPDYPAVIKRKFFVLDYDAYLQIFQEKKDIDANLDRFHEKISSYFEKSIKEDFRSLLNAE